MPKNEFDFEFEDNTFDSFEVDLESNFKTRYIKPPRTLDVPEHLLKYSNAKKLANDIQIEKEFRNFYFLDGSFYFGDFIEAIITEKKYKVPEMTLSTLSLNENNVDSLANLLNSGLVSKIDLIVSDYFFAHEKWNLIPYLYKELDKKNKFQLAAAGVHTKIYQFKTECGKFIVMHGSANMRTSGNIEQMVIEENEALYKFNLTIFAAIIDCYKTIEKSVRGKKLWQTVQQAEGKKQG